MPIELAVGAVLHDGERFAQTDGLAVEIQKRVRVVFLRGDVDLRIIFVYKKPRLSGGEARVFLGRPLHGRARGVARAAPELFQPFFTLEVQRLIARLYILVLLCAFRTPVGHADLLPLIDKGRAFLEQVRGCE